MVTIIKTIVILGIISIPLYASVGILSQYLERKSKTSKLRQWWSNNVVNLDDRYE